MTDDALIRSTLFVLSLAGSFADRAARLDRPLLVGQGFLRPYLLAEHTACAFTRDCLENTRTTLTLWLVRLFAWNMPYHGEHHAYPAVPFHALPREASRGVAAGPPVGSARPDPRRAWPRAPLAFCGTRVDNPRATSPGRLPANR
jgi:hypothetical protein